MFRWLRGGNSSRRACFCGSACGAVLRAAVARGGTEPAQNPTWQPGGATARFLGGACGTKLTGNLLVAEGSAPRS